MNVFFGITGLESASRFKLMERNVEKLFQSKVHTFNNPNCTVSCGYIHDGGVILGKAETEKHYLIYSGFLQRPLPQWEGGSPLDDPDKSASYLLSRYIKEGTSFLDGISGQYTIVICDNEQSKFFLGCDPGGFRRIFYRHDEDHLVFSTNLVSMNAAFDNGMDVDRSLEDFLLSYEFLPWNRTIFKNVTYLKAGTLLEFSEGIEKTHSISKSSSELPKIDKINYGDVSEDSAVKKLHNEFMLAVEEMCPSTNRVAVLLGGFDSMLVASTLTRLGKKVETFSFYFEDISLNQAHTDTLAKYCGTKHTWVKITPEVIQQGLQNYSLRFNQPASQPHYVIQTAHACQTIRQRGYFHCFTGDSCDELFLGYPMVHRRAKMFLKFGVIPHIVVRFLLNVSGGAFIENHLGHTWRLARNVITISGRKMPVRGHIANRIFDELSLSRLRLGFCPEQEKHPESILSDLAEGLDHLSAIRLAFHGKSVVGVNRNRNEGSSAFTGISIQSPYQYPSLSGFARSLPDELLRPKEKTKSSVTGKYILMKMAEKYALLPPEIIYQKKGSPVTSSVDQWYMASLKPFLLNAVESLPFNYDKKYIEILVKPKLAEEVFRRYFTIGRFTSQAISLLTTYSNFTKFGLRRDE